MRDQENRPAILAPEAEHQQRARDKLREAHHALREAYAAAYMAGWLGNVLYDIEAAKATVAHVRGLTS